MRAEASRLGISYDALRKRRQRQRVVPSPGQHKERSIYIDAHLGHRSLATRLQAIHDDFMPPRPWPRA